MKRLATKKISIGRRLEAETCVMTYFSKTTPKELYDEPRMFKRVYDKAWKELREIFGDETKNIVLQPRICPHCSYGHMASLGASVTFPENGDFSMKPFVGSVAEGIVILKKEQDFTNNEIFRCCVKYNEILREDFGDNSIPICGGYSCQGPVTSAVLMRGQDFFADMYEIPDLCEEFLSLLTDGIIEFHRFLRGMNGQPRYTDGMGLCDDFGSLVAPDMFDRFVIPFWDRYYSGLSTGARSLHAEGMFRPHLKKLKTAGVTHFQASVSPGLTCQMLAEELDMPFDWMLPSFEIIDMTGEQIDAWVEETASARPCPDVIRAQFLARTFDEKKEYQLLRFLNDVKKYE